MKRAFFSGFWIATLAKGFFFNSFMKTLGFMTQRFAPARQPAVKKMPLRPYSTSRWGGAAHGVGGDFCRLNVEERAYPEGNLVAASGGDWRR